MIRVQTIAAMAAGLCIAMASAAPAVAQPEEALLAQLRHFAGLMELAVKQCDFDKYVRYKEEYEKVLKVFIPTATYLKGQPPGFVPYYFPCVPTAMVTVPQPGAFALAVGLEAGFGGGDAGFAGTAFTVPVDGGVGGFYFDARTYVSQNVFLGARMGALFGDVSGSRISPENHIEHTVRIGPMAYAEGTFGFNLFSILLSQQISTSNQASGNFVGAAFISASFGGVLMDEKLTLRDTGVHTDSETTGGITAALQFGIPVMGFEFTATVRYVHPVRPLFFNTIRGEQDLWFGTIGVRMPFYDMQARR